MIKQELQKLQNNGQLRKIPNIQDKIGKKIFIDDKEYLNFASNDYLGISTNIELRNEFLKQNSSSLFSSASARLLSGSSQEYIELENTISDLFEKEATLVFNTGYQCNLGVISSLISKGDVIFSDKLNHASIIDGMLLSKGDYYRYKHFDYQHLENLLIKYRKNYNRAIIVSESIFSMDGDIVNIDKLVDLKKKYNCMLMIDEAHAFCCYGKNLAGVTYSKDVDIITATFGKAVGSFGAFCVANADIISFLINKARSFIFSTSIPPINIAWSNWLLTKKRDYIITQKQKLNELVNQVHVLLKNECINNISDSHIIPIIIGDNEKTLLVSEKLKSEGYYIPAIRPPTVKEGTSRLRISLTSNNTLQEFKQILDIIQECI